MRVYFFFTLLCSSFSFCRYFFRRYFISSSTVISLISLFIVPWVSQRHIEQKMSAIYTSPITEQYYEYPVHVGSHTQVHCLTAECSYVTSLFILYWLVTCTLGHVSIQVTISASITLWFQVEMVGVPMTLTRWRGLNRQALPGISFTRKFRIIVPD